MLDPAFAVIFRPYVYEVIYDGDGHYMLWYSLWVPTNDGETARSVTIAFVDAAHHWAELRKNKPPTFAIVGRGQDDPEALVEVWIEPDPEDV